MYWKIGPVDPGGNLSYKIAKHPDNVFERDAGPGRKVHARFAEDDKSYYLGHIFNDPLMFLKTARKLNMSNYVHTQLSAVCPHNLKGFDVCFRSVLRGKNPGGIDDSEFNENVVLDMEIGPYPVPIQQLEFWFKDAGFSITKIDTPTFSSNIKLKNITEMTVTEYLQKVYLISYYLTRKHNMVRTQTDQIEKFVKFCTGWIEELSHRNRLINGLCKYNKELMMKFETDLVEQDDTKSEDDREERKQELVDAFMNKRNLHRMRHDIIVDELSEDTETFMELGCGGGQLLRYARKKFKNLQITGLEINDFLCRKASKYRRGSKFNVVNCNVLYPKLRREDLKVDFLAITEVMEHLVEPDRRKLIRLIKQIYLPKTWVITVPNIEYNQHFEFLNEGDYRHPDHKIEYTLKELVAEIIEPLSEMYNIQFRHIETEEGITPSWILVGRCKYPEKRKIHNGVWEKIKSMYEGIYLPISDYRIGRKELASGYSGRQHMMNAKNIFYLAPTMAPVDWYGPSTEISDYVSYLEHPMKAFEYYRDRGVDVLWGEEKYMGSRGYALAFKDPEYARKLGFDAPLIINSRAGFPFFHDNGSTVLDLWQEILPHIEEDYLMFDCEIMPWAFKAEKLIMNEFRIPGECAFLSRLFGGYAYEEVNVTAAFDYLKTLDLYDSKDDPLEVRIFNILAKGAIRENKRGTFKFLDTTMGFYKPREWHYNIINTINTKTFKPVISHSIKLDDTAAIIESIESWKLFCSNGGEGFVYKLDEPIRFTDNGYMIQPMLKVRGKRYLQLIYGIDYLHKDYFEKVCYRRTKRKRMLAIQQHEVGINILRSFLNRNHHQTNKFVAGFIGMEYVNMKNIDATL